MTEVESKDRYRWGLTQRWSSWDSPIGLGLFFVLIAGAVDLVRLAFK